MGASDALLGIQMSPVEPRVTIFAIPKPFVGLAALHQQNAIRSWTRLRDAEVVLCGDEAGVADAAHKLGTRHAPDVARNEHGTPLVSAAFKVVSDLASAPVLCYVNADILLMSDFPSALRKLTFRDYLLCGRRRDLDVLEAINFEAAAWERDLFELVRTTGRLHAVEAMDYFAFPRGLFACLPPFTVGRAMWDNWLVFHARSLRVPVVDATAAVVAVHQNHDYGHIRGGIQAVWHGSEASCNRALAADMLYPFTIDDATFELASDGRCRRRSPWTAARLLRSEVALGVRERPRLRRFIRKILHAHGT